MRRLILLATASSLAFTAPVYADSLVPAAPAKTGAGILLAQSSAAEAEEEFRRRVTEPLARQRAEQLEQQRQRAEEQRQRAEEQQRQRAEERQRQRAEEQQRQRAEEQQRQRAEERQRQRAEEQQRQRAEERQRQRAEEQQRQRAEERQRERAEERQRERAEERQRERAEERQRERAEERQRERAEERQRAEELERRRAEERQRERAEERRQAEERQRAEQERRDRERERADQRRQDEQRAEDRRDRRDRREERVRVEDPIAPIGRERGERIRDDRDVATRPRWRDRRDAREVREFDDRVIFRLGDGSLVVERRDGRDERLRRRSGDVMVERLGGGRVRETVQRANATIVTIYGPNGEILRRSRITPDGREQVLFYVPRDRWDDMPIGRERWDRDYGLPPLRVTVPRDRYIWEPYDATSDDYYDFLEQPPVERAERLYSVDEVRYSERLRDKLPRIDLETVNFAFGSAEIREEDIGKLQDLADAINRIIERSPTETFLIEGHTDAVGSETANLALSDRRAENVAIALTDVFAVPPENLVTQGYGESDLKVETEERSAANRRVTVRRITPLVSPETAAVAQ